VNPNNFVVIIVVTRA